MSRPISESVSLLTETLGNCKTALTEKQVADVDNIKVSDIDEKITEIKAGESTDIIALKNKVIKTFDWVTKTRNYNQGEKFKVTISEEAYNTYLKTLASDNDIYLCGLLISLTTNNGSVDRGSFIKWKNNEEDDSYYENKIKITEGRTVYSGELAYYVQSPDHLIYFIFSDNKRNFFDGVFARTCETGYM